MFPFRKEDFENFDDDPAVPAIAQVKWKELIIFKWAGLTVLVFAFVAFSVYISHYLWIVFGIIMVTMILWKLIKTIREPKLRVLMNIEGIYCQLFKEHGLILWSNIYTTKIIIKPMPRGREKHLFHIDFNLKYRREKGVDDITIDTEEFNIAPDRINYIAKVLRYRHHLLHNELPLNTAE